MASKVPLGGVCVCVCVRCRCVCVGGGVPGSLRGDSIVKVHFSKFLFCGWVLLLVYSVGTMPSCNYLQQMQ